MKKIALILSLVLIFGCKSKSVIQEPAKPKIVKISLSDVDDSQKSKAYELGKRILMTCNTSKFKPFNSTEATPSVIKNMTQERLTKTCLKFRLRYGDFNDLQLVEVFKDNNDNTTLYRYKALYEKKIANKELRVSLNKQNQISAVKSLDWIDTFQNN